MDQRLALAYGVAGLSAAIAIVTVFSSLSAPPDKPVDPTPPAVVATDPIATDPIALDPRPAPEGREHHERHERGEREEGEDD